MLRSVPQERFLGFKRRKISLSGTSLVDVPLHSTLSAFLLTLCCAVRGSFVTSGHFAIACCVAFKFA